MFCCQGYCRCSGSGFEGDWGGGGTATATAMVLHTERICCLAITFVFTTMKKNAMPCVDALVEPMRVMLTLTCHDFPVKETQPQIGKLEVLVCVCGERLKRRKTSTSLITAIPCKLPFHDTLGSFHCFHVTF